MARTASEFLGLAKARGGYYVNQPSPFPGKWPTRICMSVCAAKGEEVWSYIGKPSTSAFLSFRKQMHERGRTGWVQEFDKGGIIYGWKMNAPMYPPHTPITRGMLFGRYFPFLNDKNANGVTVDLFTGIGKTRRHRHSSRVGAFQFYHRNVLGTLAKTKVEGIMAHNGWVK